MNNLRARATLQSYFQGARKKVIVDPDVIRTRSLLIWSQTRYHCATESTDA